MGWTPEYKFIGARWDTYCELMMMYLLAIAAPIYNISPSVMGRLLAADTGIRRLHLHQRD